MDKNKRSMILKSGAFLTALVATGLVNNGVSADETAAPTGPTDNATVATGHSDTLLNQEKRMQRFRCCLICSS